jgi:UDP-2,4-diacetamido-2,4,6-trideoxy-beta-L-altropyranose hydrolase
VTGDIALSRIVIRCDASDTMGGGHAMRCLTLANALAGKGAEVVFVTASMPVALEERIAGAGHRIERIPPSPDLQREGSEWEEPPLSAEAQVTDAIATGVAAGRSDWTIVDHYLLDAHWHSAARAFADHVLVIDDLANRSCDCDILLDQTFGRSAEDYRELVPRDARVLAGATYALLRPEFARERSAALKRRRRDEGVRRILISMGTADPDGITARILHGVLAVVPECAIDVILGSEASSLDHVRRLADSSPRISVHVNSERMAELMRDADIAMGAAGTTSWERCCLGLPTITHVLAENQRLVAANLERAGATVVADTLDTIPLVLRRLVDDEHMRLSITAAAAAIVDGFGVERLCKQIFGSSKVDLSQLRLRPAESSDKEALWLWRNDPLMRAMAKGHQPIIWSEHARWFDGVMESGRTTLYIANLSSEAAAMVRFDERGSEALVSINVAPSLRGQGVGTAALIRACDAYERDHPAVAIIAEIRHSNTASKSAFRAAGFEKVGQTSAEISKFIRRRVAAASTS